MTTAQRRVLIIGGYGFFGGRLARMLATDPRLEILVAGRNLGKATEFCRAAGQQNLRPVKFDRSNDVLRQLRALAADLVVDAAGPFQHYGNLPYAVAEAAIACDAHYLDIADGRDFVSQIAILEPRARAAGLFVISGVSTHPALTCAVIRHLAADLQDIDTVTTGLVPSRQAGVGLSVVEAIASYAGRSLTVRRGGETRQARAQIDSVHREISVSGLPPLQSQRFTLMDVPDHDVVPQAWPDIADVWTGVAPTPPSAHRLLTVFAWLVRLRILRSLSPLARIMHMVPRLFWWGETRGAMFVSVRGLSAADGHVDRTWSLIAPGSTGPDVPMMACAALIAKWLDGKPPPPGARAADGDLSLADYQPYLDARAIQTGHQTRPVSSDGKALYEQALGDLYDGLGPAVLTFHQTGWQRRASGRASVVRGRNPIARLIAMVIGFPAATDDTAVRVVISRDGDSETWERKFGNARFASTQFLGRIGAAGEIVEKFGPFAFDLQPAVNDGQLTLGLTGWRAGPIPLPKILAPHIAATETDRDGRFHFDVRVAMPMIGLIAHYRGWLTPEVRAASSMTTD